MRSDKQGHDELVILRATPTDSGPFPSIMAWQPWAPAQPWPAQAPSVRWLRLEPLPGHVLTAHLFSLDLPIIADGDLTDCLSMAERDRAARFRFAQHAHRNRVGRAMARHLLAHWPGCTRTMPASAQVWVEGPHGKPALAHHGAPRFNLSHSNGWALLVVSDTLEVGVDLEELGSRAHLDGMASRILSPGELHAQSSPLSEDALLCTWVRKEACLKALGVGLSHEMSALTLNVTTGDGHGQATFDGCGSSVHWADLPLPPDCLAQACWAWRHPEPASS